MADHQLYIQSRVNPILESLVTALLLDKPTDPIGFMITWLSQNNSTQTNSNLGGGNTNSNNNNDPAYLALRDQVQHLKRDVNDLENRLGISPSGGGSPGGNDSEEDDDSDCVDEMPEVPASYANKGPRTSVSAEAYGKWNTKKDYTPVVIPKDDQTKDRIRGILNKSFLFNSLDKSSVEVIVDAMSEVRCGEGERLIVQGDDGDSLFLIEEGVFHCKIKNSSTNNQEIVVKTCEPGDLFGELALLYNCPRAASVDAAGAGNGGGGGENALLWKLDRETFNAIVKDAACKKRERYEQFLKSVSILKDLGGYEISQISDALCGRDVMGGENVVRQGEPGDTFYIVESGNLYAYKENDPSTSLLEYQSGMFFGELALLKSDVRAASVMARSESRVLSIDRKTFSRLLGPLGELLEAHAQSNY